MNIALCAQHPYWGGLSNNGGSRTILLSCDALNKMGHRAVVVTSSDKYTWHKHEKPVKKIPADTDVCIACSVSDIDTMLAKKPKKAEAMWWCRLLETYQMPENKIVKRARYVKTLVNSEGLQRWFARHGVNTTIAYQGVDAERWIDMGKRGDKPVIGVLMSAKPRKHCDIVEKIVNELGDEYDYIGYGAKKDQTRDMHKLISRKFINFKTNVGYTDLLIMYNMAHTWVSTSTQEGLHNPPLEAALCGCAVVYPDSELSGCSDYCDDETAWQYEALNYKSACEAIRKADKSKNEKQRQLIANKIGNRLTAMGRMVEIL